MCLKKNHDFVLELAFYVLALVTIYAFRESVNGYTIVYINYIFAPLLFLYLKIKKIALNRLWIIYILSLSLGTCFHVVNNIILLHDVPNELFVRITPILLLLYFLKKKESFRSFHVFFIMFYIVECCLAVYEKITLTHILSYSEAESLMATSATMDDTRAFRAFSLMFHPLYNANVVSIFMAFVLCSKMLGLRFKIILFVLGGLALWAFNSRGAIIIWGIILLYRFFFYNRSLIFIILAVLFLYLSLPPLIEYLVYSGVLGRIESFDFTDSSSLSRIEAFTAFCDVKWTFYDVIEGGIHVCYPGTNLDVENGILMDLGYWGWIIGFVKIVLEVMFSLYALKKYPVQEKILFFLAIWGVAFMNNNSFNSWLLPMFVMCYATFTSIENNYEGTLYNK